MQHYNITATTNILKNEKGYEPMKKTNIEAERAKLEKMAAEQKEIIDKATAARADLEKQIDDIAEKMTAAFEAVQPAEYSDLKRQRREVEDAITMLDAKIIRTNEAPLIGREEYNNLVHELFETADACSNAAWDSITAIIEQQLDPIREKLNAELKEINELLGFLEKDIYKDPERKRDEERGMYHSTPNVNDRRGAIELIDKIKGYTPIKSRLKKSIEEEPRLFFG